MTTSVTPEQIVRARKGIRAYAKQLGIPKEQLDKLVPEGDGKPKRKVFMKVSSFMTVEVKQLVWAMRHVLLMASLNLFTGDPDIGKTLVAIYYIAALSRLGKKTIIICREDDYGSMWKPRLVVANAKLENIFAVHHVGIEGTDEEIHWMLDNAEHLEMLHSLIAEHKATLCLIDPLADFNGKLDLNKGDDVRTITRGLANIAKKTGVAMLVNCHTTKAVVDHGIKAPAGSFQLSAAVQVSWLFIENRDVKGERLMLQGRNKSGKKRSFKYEITSAKWPEEICGKEQLEEGEESEGVGLVVFKGKTDLTAEDVLERKLEKGESKISRACRSVAEILANGPQKTGTCWDTMRALGFDSDTVQKACTRLEVVRNTKTQTWTLPTKKEEKKEEEKQPDIPF